MNFNLSTEKKISIAQASLLELEQIKVNLITSFGEDPNTFECGEVSDQNTPAQNSLYDEIGKIELKIQNIQNLIQELL